MDMDSYVEILALRLNLTPPSQCLALESNEEDCASQLNQIWKLDSSHSDLSKTCNLKFFHYFIFQICHICQYYHQKQPTSPCMHENPMHYIDSNPTSFYTKCRVNNNSVDQLLRVGFTASNTVCLSKLYIKSNSALVLQAGFFLVFDSFIIVHCC